MAYAVLAGIVILPLALPVLPPSALATVALAKVNYNLGETIGWPSFVSTVASIYRSFPVAERSAAVLLTANYGEAGALDRFGPALGLPPAFSGHNSYSWWGPPNPPRLADGALGATIAVGFDRPYLERFYRQVTLVAHNRNQWHVSNDEEQAPIWICRGQRESWAAIWPRLKHYG